MRVSILVPATALLLFAAACSTTARTPATESHDFSALEAMAAPVKGVAPPRGRDEFCRLARTSHFQRQIQDDDNRLSFGNEPGPLGIGICWWHSRFERAATMTLVYRPDLPKPSGKERDTLVRNVVSSLRRASRVVEVPGYANLHEFSHEHAEAIQKAIGDWQLGDTLTFKWLQGLKGDTKESPDYFENLLRDLGRRVNEKGEVVFQMLQQPGFAAHSHLVVAVTKLRNGDYLLKTIDSNPSWADTSASSVMLYLYQTIAAREAFEKSGTRPALRYLERRYVLDPASLSEDDRDNVERGKQLSRMFPSPQRLHINPVEFRELYDPASATNPLIGEFSLAEAVPYTFESGEHDRLKLAQFRYCNPNAAAILKRFVRRVPQYGSRGQILTYREDVDFDRLKSSGLVTW